jgi:hypothetical protein
MSTAPSIRIGVTVPVRMHGLEGDSSREHTVSTVCALSLSRGADAQDDGIKRDARMSELKNGTQRIDYALIMSHEHQAMIRRVFG